MRGAVRSARRLSVRQHLVALLLHSQRAAPVGAGQADDQAPNGSTACLRLQAGRCSACGGDQQLHRQACSGPWARETGRRSAPHLRTLSILDVSRHASGQHSWRAASSRLCSVTAKLVTKRSLSSACTAVCWLHLRTQQAQQLAGGSLAFACACACLPRARLLPLGARVGRAQGAQQGPQVLRACRCWRSLGNASADKCCWCLVSGRTRQLEARRQEGVQARSPEAQPHGLCELHASSRACWADAAAGLQAVQGGQARQRLQAGYVACTAISGPQVLGCSPGRPRSCELTIADIPVALAVLRQACWKLGLGRAHRSKRRQLVSPCWIDAALWAACRLLWRSLAPGLAIRAQHGQQSRQQAQTGRMAGPQPSKALLEGLRKSCEEAPFTFGGSFAQPVALSFQHAPGGEYDAAGLHFPGKPEADWLVALSAPCCPAWTLLCPQALSTCRSCCRPAPRPASAEATRRCGLMQVCAGQAVQPALRR